MLADYFKKGKHCNPVQGSKTHPERTVLSGPGFQQGLDLSFTYIYIFSYEVF